MPLSAVPWSRRRPLVWPFTSLAAVWGGSRCTVRYAAESQRVILCSLSDVPECPGRGGGDPGLPALCGERRNTGPPQHQASAAVLCPHDAGRLLNEDASKSVLRSAAVVIMTSLCWDEGVRRSVWQNVASQLTSSGAVVIDYHASLPEGAGADGRWMCRETVP